MNPTRIEIRLSSTCGDSGLAQIRDVIREKALRPPGTSGLVFIVPTPDADVMIDTHVRRINASRELIAALVSLDVVDAADLVGELIQNVA
ncbi:hypothetical protein [Microvirga sp. VF16]|uniref:hypothetical protein n=1 Tax=Microvirga sp. VF16 TaxID=2807101 RepID=UPI00193CC34D|nr:hypothetical protein [Microvirga sp. VF16]QRM35019.1 hypothetical protein JO965_39145 [Microvirga sp. VF16]